jgi:hypothetical protein
MLTNLTKTIAVAMLLAPMSALAAPVTVDFTIQGTYGLSGGDFESPTYNGYDAATATGSGWFTIDDSIGNFYDTTVGAAPAAFHLEFLGVTFTETNTRLYSASFTPLGLDAWSFGAYSGAGDCGLACVASAGPSDFWIYGNYGSLGLGYGVVHDVDAVGWMYGSVSWAIRTTPVPEPATFGLLGAALLGTLGLRRRRIN